MKTIVTYGIGLWRKFWTVSTYFHIFKKFCDKRYSSGVTVFYQTKRSTDFRRVYIQIRIIKISLILLAVQYISYNWFDSCWYWLLWFLLLLLLFALIYFFTWWNYMDFILCIWFIGNTKLICVREAQLFSLSQCSAEDQKPFLLFHYLQLLVISESCKVISSLGRALYPWLVFLRWPTFLLH